MSGPPPSLIPALQRLRMGDVQGARAAVTAALAKEPDHPALVEFAGLLAAQSGDHRAATEFFGHLLARSPGNRAVRVNLATALLAAGELDEAGEVSREAEGDPKLLRISAYVHQERGRLEAAERDYQAVVAASPVDFESWNNLGNVRAAKGDHHGAITAFQEAIAIRPDIVQIYINLSEALAATEQNEQRLAVIRELARVVPEDPLVQTELGHAASAVRSFDEAEQAHREAIRLTPGFTASFLELGLLLENRNRVEELAALVDEAEARGMQDAELGFIRAWVLRRQGRLDEAYALAEATPPSINPVRRAQLVAELADRLGDPDKAFEQFSEMNKAAIATRPAPEGPTYREQVIANSALITPERVAEWTHYELDLVPPPPIVIAGFPRSGTTLLDTLLMNMPQLHVLEELPVLRQVELALGSQDRLATLSREEAQDLRSLYYQALAVISPMDEGKTVVDKYPLHLAHVPLIHRIFPDARIVLVERHPCDAVLSCYMANFQMNLGMRSFTDLEEAARTYDAVFESWERATSLLPVQVHRIRYEKMVEDLEGEMRPLLQFLDLPWDPKVLDNQGSAAKRDHIRTASYSQVTEPIYRRAAGRWERYRKHLEPVLPILAPWAERMGYEI